MRQVYVDASGRILALRTNEGIATENREGIALARVLAVKQVLEIQLLACKKKLLFL